MPDPEQPPVRTFPIAPSYFRRNMRWMVGGMTVGACLIVVGVVLTVLSRVEARKTVC